MPSEAQQPMTESVWWMMLGAMSAAVPVYAFLLETVHWEPSASPVHDPATVRLAFGGLAIVASAAALGVSRSRIRPRLVAGAPADPGSSLLPAERFGVVGVLALALAEIPAICGFVFGMLMRTGARAYAPFGFVSLVLLLVEIAPSSRAYWRARRAQAGSAPKPIG